MRRIRARRRRPVGVRGTVGLAVGALAAVSVLGAPGASGAAGSVTSATVAPVHRPAAVGSLRLVFVDRSRPTPSEPGFPGRTTRTLPTLVLYPARGASGAVVPGAPVLRGASPSPLIVFSHGNSSGGPDYQPLLRQWASQGYVVAAPTYPLTSHGQIADYVHQPGDVSFVIDQVLRLDRQRSSPLFGLIDRARIGVAGHSLGAVTTLGVSFNTCCADPRVKAVVSISGITLPFSSGQYFTGRVLPLLLLHGTADQEIPFHSSELLFAQDPGPRYFVTLIGAPHTSFRQRDTASHPAPPWERVDVRVVTDFFDYYLKGEKDGLGRLGVDANVAGVASLQQAD